MPSTFTLAFLAAIAVSTSVRIWLARRHVAHVAAHRDAVPPGFADRIPLAAHRKAADYTVEKTRLGVVHTLVDVAALLALTLGGVLATIDAFWAARLDGGIVRGIALIVSVSLLMSLVELPLSIRRVFGIEARYGFNRMTPAMFAADLAKQTAVSAALGIPLVAAVLWLMQRMGELWWLYVWLAWSGFSVLMLLLYPTLIAPLFNKFSHLPDGELKSRIERLLARCGFRAQGLYVMDGSRRSSHGNAYFTGFGRARRIVFFDTLISRLAPGEIEAVLAHELGHFRLRHVVKRMAGTFAASLAFLWVLGQVIDAPWFYEGLGVAYPAIPAMSLLLFFLAMPPFMFFLHPIAARWSRKHEFEADAYAAQHASGVELMQALVKLYEDNASTLTPDPLHSAFYDSHPPAAARIARLMQAAQT